MYITHLLALRMIRFLLKIERKLGQPGMMREKLEYNIPQMLQKKIINIFAIQIRGKNPNTIHIYR